MLLRAAPWPNLNSTNERWYDISSDRLGRVGRTPLGQAQDDVEHLQGVDHAQHEYDADHGPQVGPGDVPERLPTGRAIKRTRLVELLRDVL